MAGSHAERGWTVFVLPSSHNDIGWAGTPSEIAEHRASAIVDAVLAAMERDQDYAFAMEAALYLHEYLERRPERSASVLRYMREGCLEWGASYVQPYEALLSGESLIRQLYWGRGWMWRQLGVEAAGYWNIDVEARTAQLPQILAKAGVRYMVLSRNEPGLYWWEAPDGSRILVLSFMEGAYGLARVFNTRALHFSPLEAAHAYRQDHILSLDGIASELLPLLQQWEPFFAAHHLPRYFLIAATADYAVPDERLQALIRQWNTHVQTGALALPMPVRLRFGNVAQYVAALQEEADLSTLPTVRGEMPNPWVYIHGPCHHKTVAAMRSAASYLTTAEMFSAALSLLGEEAGFDRRAAMARAWQDHLYPDHGYGGLHGEGTDEIFRYKEESAWYSARGMAHEAMTAIVQAIPLPDQAVQVIVVFNPLSWSRTDWVETEILFSPDDAITSVRLVDSEGEPVPMQVIDVAHTANGQIQRLRLGFIARDMPSIGYRAYYLDAQPGDLPAGLTRLEATLPGDYTWENDALRVRITCGGLVECFDKWRRRTLLAADHYLGFEVVEMGSPGHDVGEGERDITAFDWRAVRPFQPTAYGLERTAERGSGLTLLEDGPLRTRVTTVSDFRHGTVRQTFTLYRDLDRVDVAVDIVSWKGTHGREFRLLFPLGMAEACISYDVPFGYIRVGQDELHGFAHMRPREVQSWLHAGGDDLDVTLSSSVVAHDWIDPLGWTNRPILQAVLLATKRSCHPKGPWYTQEGNHGFWASITGGAHSVEERARFGGAQQRPLEAIVLGRSAHSSATAVPPIQSFLSVEPANVVVTSFKRSAAGDGLIVRCCEIAGRYTDAAIQMSTPVRSISRCDLLEDEEAVIWSGAQPTQQVSIPMSAFGIATVKLRQ